MKTCYLMLVWLVGMVTVGVAQPTDNEQEEGEEDDSQHSIRNPFSPCRGQASAHLAPIGAFRALVKKFKMLEKTIKNSPVKLTGCNTRDVGYAYKQSNDIKYRNEDTRELDHLVYTKKRDDTVLLITYSSNVRTIGANRAARWFVKVDGHECSVPSKIDIGMYQSDGGHTHVPAVLRGICKATAAGPLRKGNHRISTHVGKLRNHHPADSMSNWVTEVLLEVQEICPGF